MNQYKLYLTLEVGEDYDEDYIKECMIASCIQLTEDLEAYIVDLEIKQCQSQCGTSTKQI